MAEGIGGLTLDQATFLKELGKENARLKRLAAVLFLEEDILKEVVEGSF